MNPVIFAFLQFALLLVGMGALIAMLIAFMLVGVENTPTLIARKWKEAVGVVTESYVLSENVSDGANKFQVLYRPAVSYRYIVKENIYDNDRIYFGAKIMYEQREEAEKKLDKYAAGAPVRVYYNPAWIQDSVLERSVPQASKMNRLAIGLLLLSIAGFVSGFLLPNWIAVQ